MKKSFLYHVVIVFFFAVSMLFLTACATDKAQHLKRQEQGYRDVGREYMAQQKYTLALRELLKAEKLYSEDHVLHDYLGICYQEKENFNLALEHFNKALEIKPDYGIARNNLGSTYLKMKEWDKAIEQFKMLTESNYVDIYLTPHYPLFNLGRAYYSKKDFKQAQVYYEEALAYYKDGFGKDKLYALVVIGLSRTYLALTNYVEATALLKDMAEEYSDDARIHFELANAYLASGNFGAALISYRQVVKLAPDSPIGGVAAAEIERLGNPGSLSD